MEHIVGNAVRCENSELPQPLHIKPSPQATQTPILCYHAFMENCQTPPGKLPLFSIEPLHGFVNFPVFISHGLWSSNSCDKRAGVMGKSSFSTLVLVSSKIPKFGIRLD